MMKKPRPRPEPAPVVLAWREWQASEMGRRALDAASLGLPESQAEYLMNRLWHAFMAGAGFSAREEMRKREAARAPSPA